MYLAMAIKDKLIYMAFWCKNDNLFNTYVTIEQNRSPDQRTAIRGKNPAVIRRLSTHPALIRRWPGKFNSQLKFARRLPDASPLFLIRQRPVGHRPIPERRSVGHHPKCSGKNLQAIERRSGNLRSMTAQWSPCHRTKIRQCLLRAHAWRPSCDSRAVTREAPFDDPAIATDDCAGILRLTPWIPHRI